MRQTRFAALRKPLLFRKRQRSPRRRRRTRWISVPPPRCLKRWCRIALALQMNAVRIGPPELRRDIANPDRTPRLLIYLTITNMGDRPLDYLSWGPGGRIATLSAMNGVQLTPIMFPKGSLLNHPQQATVSPHGQERDVLVYAPMYPMPRLLALDLPCGNIGSIGSMHLLVTEFRRRGK